MAALTVVITPEEGELVGKRAWDRMKKRDNVINAYRVAA